MQWTLLPVLKEWIPLIFLSSSFGKIIIQQKMSYGDGPSGAPGNVRYGYRAVKRQ